jgi:class 3 adenylate cyclase/tetratricopeptide (TPR) repeat protein
MAFCTACGQALVVAPVPAGPTLPGPEEERRLVSVLAVDLVGFSLSAQQLDPEDLQVAQREFFEVVRVVVQNAGGTVAKRIGDAVVAVFGAPTAYENDPYRAVRAGLEVQASLAGRTMPDGRPLVARVGVSTGEALVAFEADRAEPRVAGDVLSRAMGMQACAPPGGVLVGLQTHRATSSTIAYEDHAQVVLAGRGAPIDSWVATGLRARSGVVEDALPLVGRDAETGLLVSALRRAMQERRGQLVTLVGEPGLGKSRLTRALLEHIDSPATPTLVRWRVGACLPYGEGVSYWALGQVVKAQAQVLESDSGALARHKLEASVDSVLGRGAGPDLVAQVKERMAALLGLPGTGGEVADGGDEVDASHAAWRRYLLALAEDSPTVLVLEDLHWADDGFLDFLRSLVEAATSVPLLVLATARPELLERRPDWVAGLSDGMTITLTPLTEPETETVLARLLGDTVLPAPLQRRLLDLVNGNPLYAEEYVRMLTDTGVLGAHSRDLLADLPLPDSVQGVVDSRLDLLTAAERSVVSAAAVVGQTFWEGAIAAVADADRDEVLACLEALEQREVVRRIPRATMAGEREFAFRHVLVRDAAYHRIPRSIRVVQHQRCAEWLDRFSPERGDDVAELRAHHRTTAYELAAVLGADLEPYAQPARQALVTAAERALRLHAVSAAHGFARRAVMLWYGHEDDPAALKTALLAAELAFLDDPHAFYADGGPAKVLETAEKLLELGDRRAAAKAQVLLGQAEWYRGGGAELSARHLQRAVDLLAEEPASEQSTHALAELGRLRMLSHQYADAIALSDRAMAIARPLGLLEVEANALITAGTARYSLGDPLGIVQQEEALRLCRQHGLRALQRAANNLATTMQEEGRLRRSYELIDESARATRGWGLSLTTRADDSEMALMAWYDGQWDRLLEHTEAFLATAGAEAQQWESHLLALAGIVRALRGEPVPAELDHIVERARRSGFPSLVRSALAHLGCCRFLQGRTEEAARLFDELMAHTATTHRGSVREWVYTAVLLGEFLGEGRVEQMAAKLAVIEPKTPWVVGAHHAARSFVAADNGKYLDAVEHATEALAVYERIGDVSTTTFARARLARTAHQAGDLVTASEQGALVREFVDRNHAVVFAAYLPPL